MAYPTQKRMTPPYPVPFRPPLFLYISKPDIRQIKVAPTLT